MCCRYHLSESHYREVLARLGIPAPAAFTSRYNIAPSTAIPVVRLDAQRQQREAIFLRWGLTPAWARHDEAESRLVNARAETLATKPSFREPLRWRRCVMPASGFYEWETVGRAKKPWLFRRRDERPFGLAGLWESWRSPEGDVVESCAVVTTTPNALMQPIHHRMPLMLTPAQCEAWLDPRLTRVEDFSAVLQPPPAETMSVVAVSTRVSNVRYDAPDCIAPAPATETADDDEPQLSLGW